MEIIRGLPVDFCGLKYLNISYENSRRQIIYSRHEAIQNKAYQALHALCYEINEY